MNRKIMLVLFTVTLITFLILMTLASCVPEGYVQPEARYTQKESPLSDNYEERVLSRVVRYIDTQADVVCWIYGDGGIDCMPIEDTDLQ